MKTLSAAECLTIRGISAHSLNNICIGDFDSDGDNELALCGWSTGRLLQKSGEADVERSFGVMYVLKYNRLSWTADEMSVASYVTSGDVCNIGKTFLIVTCIDCDLYLYHVDHIDPTPAKIGLFIRMEHKNGENTVMKPGPCHKLKPIQHTLLPCNANSAIVADIDGNGANELLVAGSDRIVRLFRWCSSSSTAASRLAPGSDWRSALEGGFEILMEWELAAQIGNIALHRSEPSGAFRILASQPGGTLAELHHQLYEEDEHGDSLPYVTYDPLSNGVARGHNVRTEVVTQVARRCDGDSSSEPDYAAVSTYDGNLLLLELGPAPTSVQMLNKGKLLPSTYRLLWEVQLQRQLFGITKVPLKGLTNNRSSGEAVVATSWDGVTYLVDDRRQMFRFVVGLPSHLFTAGLYAVQPGENVTAFVYAFTAEVNHVAVYFNFDECLPLPPQSLLHVLSEEWKAKLEDPDGETASHNPLSVQRTSDAVPGRQEPSERVRHLLYEQARLEKTKPESSHA